MHQISVAQQAIGILNSDQINCNASSTGDLFNRFLDDNLPGFEVPAGSELRTIGAANLWIGGRGLDQQLHLAAETFEINGHDWFSGPLTTDGNASTTEDTQEAWNHVHLANSEDVHNHQIYFNAINTGQPDPFQGNYSIPEWFFEWPAHGNTALGQDYYIAPFWDYNNNGFYDPENGDFPVFCGDQCLFFVFNDKGNIHTESQGQSIGLEVHGMLYSFDSSDENVSNTVFLKYKLMNRGAQTLIDTYLGLWNDFEIGNDTDDFVGTNVRRGSIYGYNGDDFDEAHYEADLPLQSMMILAGPYMDPDEMDNPLPDLTESSATQSYGPAGRGFGDAVIDNERLGLCSSIYYNNDDNSMNGEPASPQQYYNYFKSIWKNGAHLMSGGNGASGDLVTDVEASYVYPGESDPLNLGTNGVDVDLWTETTGQNLPGDRRMIGAMGPFTLNPGDVQPVDVAYVFSRHSEPGNDNHLQFHDNRELAIRNYFENIWECEVDAEMLLSTPETKNESKVGIFPNPADDLIQITATGFSGNTQFIILDALGQTALSGTLSSGKRSIDIYALSPGLYHLTITDKKHLASTRIIVK